MNRPKFRAYDKILQCYSRGSMELSYDNDGWFSIFARDRFIIEQYTGLLDSGGKEICAGDIVDFTYWWFDGNVAESHLVGEVVYLPKFLSFGLRGVKNADWIRHIGGKDGESDTAPFATWLFDEADFRVIGNIHANPELLETPHA